MFITFSIDVLVEQNSTYASKESICFIDMFYDLLICINICCHMWWQLLIITTATVTVRRSVSISTEKALPPSTTHIHPFLFCTYTGNPSCSSNILHWWEFLLLNWFTWLHQFIYPWFLYNSVHVFTNCRFKRSQVKKKWEFVHVGIPSHLRKVRVLFVLLCKNKWFKSILHVLISLSTPYAVTLYFQQRVNAAIELNDYQQSPIGLLILIY